MSNVKSIQNTNPYSWGDHCLAWPLLQSESLSVKQEEMPVHSTENLHCHEFSQQLFYILSGTAIFEINGEVEIITTNQSIHIPKKTLHLIKNNGPDKLSFLVISAPEIIDDRIEIIAYSDENKDSIKILNSEWLKKYYTLEPNDLIQLSNPKEEILDKGGLIYYAKYRDEIVGTISLLKIQDTIFELAKMAVTEEAQGHGIGNILMQHCLNIAKQNKMTKLILYSNTELNQAIHLYYKYGFKETDMEAGHYQRSNIKMELNLIEE